MRAGSSCSCATRATRRRRRTFGGVSCWRSSRATRRSTCPTPRLASARTRRVWALSALSWIKESSETKSLLWLLFFFKRAFCAALGERNQRERPSLFAPVSGPISRSARAGVSVLACARRARAVLSVVARRVGRELAQARGTRLDHQGPHEPPRRAHLLERRARLLRVGGRARAASLIRSTPNCICSRI